MVKVYRPDGTEEEKTSVDARECVQHCGYSYEPPKPIVSSGHELLTEAGNSEARTLEYTAPTDADNSALVETAVVTNKKGRGKAIEEAPAVEQIHDPND